MIPHVHFIVVIFEILSFLFDNFQTEDRDDEDDALDFFLISNLIVIIQLIHQCNIFLDFKETFDLITSRRAHKLIRNVTGYR